MAKAKDPSKDGRRNNGGPRPKTRPDDKRGPSKGESGQQPFVPTASQRDRVKNLARSCTDQQIADMEDISKSTLQRHFSKELNLGRAETTALIGSKLIEAALGGCKARQMFYLRTRGGWTATIAHVGENGGPIRTMSFDLSGYSAEELALLRPLIQDMIANHPEATDPDLMADDAAIPE